MGGGSSRSRGRSRRAARVRRGHPSGGRAIGPRGRRVTGVGRARCPRWRSPLSARGDNESRCGAQGRRSRSALESQRSGCGGLRERRPGSGAGARRRNGAQGGATSECLTRAPAPGSARFRRRRSADHGRGPWPRRRRLRHVSRPGGSDGTKGAFGSHRAEEPLQGHLNILPPGDGRLELQAQAGEAMMGTYGLEADGEQVLGGDHA